MAELAKWAGIGGTVLTAGGDIYAGRAEKRSADDEAAQLNRRALARRAEAQSGAREDRRQARLVQSKARARVAASGGSLADPSIVNYMADAEGEGEFAALTRLYEGYEEAAGLDDAATVRRREGRAARTAGYLRGLSSAFAGFESLSSKYGRST